MRAAAAVAPGAGAASSAGAGPVLRVEDLAVSFPGSAPGRRAHATLGVRLAVFPGQTVAVVGESGCGKSVTAMSLLRLIPTPPARIEGGRAMFRAGPGEAAVDLLALPARELRRVRGGRIAMIFQEPMTSLNPVFTIGEQIVEAVRLHQGAGAREARDIAAEALREVGIADPLRRMRAYPHEFSGGMRQRAMIAGALACRPALLLADEPTTALDVTVQAQILELLAELQRRRGMSVLFITHALGVVAQVADVVCVMYGGRVVECASVVDLFEDPLHPYTRGLLACAPAFDPSAPGREERLRTVRDVVENPGEFERLPGAARALRPWWPWHEAPVGVSAADPFSLVEIAPRRWVGVWRTPAASGWPETFPEIDAVRAAGRG